MLILVNAKLAFLREHRQDISTFVKVADKLIAFAKTYQ